MVRRSDTTLSRNGQRKLGGRNTFSMDLDTSGLKQYLQQLEDGVKEAIRPAAQAAAQVVYDRVKLNVQGIGKVTGNLDRLDAAVCGHHQQARAMGDACST